jgi:hypothetical protein
MKYSSKTEFDWKRVFSFGVVLGYGLSSLRSTGYEEYRKEIDEQDMILPKLLSQHPASQTDAGDNNKRDSTFVVADQRLLRDAGHPSHVTLPVIPR